MANLSDLGQRVKAKYPGVYDDMPDDAVGRAVKAKFPGQYDDFTEGPALQSSHTPGEGPYKEKILATAGNVPVTMQTGDPATDRRIAENVWEQGHQRAITPRDALQFGAAAASLGAGSLALGPVAGGALGGALWSAGTSDATTPGRFAVDVGSGLVTGGGVGKGMQLAGRALRPVGEYLTEKGITYGRKALSGVSNSLARRKPLPEAAVREAYDVGAIRPGSTVKTIADRLQDAADPLSQRYADVLQKLETAGVHGPEAEALALKFASDASSVANNTIVGTEAAALQDTADALSRKALPITGRGRLGLMQAETMKRELQKDAASQYVKEGPTSLAGAAKKEIAGRFKDSIEQAVQEQAALAPREAAEFQPVKEKLHNTLTALGAAREGAARYSRRSPFGLHEAMGLATGIASGNPVEAMGAAGLMSALKERGASTLGAGFFGAGNALSRLPMTPSPRALASGVPIGGEAAHALAEALRRRFALEALAPALADQDPRIGAAQ